MDFTNENKVEQRSINVTPPVLEPKQSDLNAYRQMTASPNAEKPLPPLFIDGASTKVEIKTPVDLYKERESQRALDYSKKFEQGSSLEKTLLTISSLPSDMSIVAKPGQLKLSSNDFSKVAETIPAATLDKTFRDILVGLKSADLNGSSVKIEGEAKVPVPLPGGMSAEAVIKNPSFKIVPDAKDGNVIRLEDISGISIGKLGVGGDIKQVTFSLLADEQGQKSLQIEIPKPEHKKAKPFDVFGKLEAKIGNALNSAVLDEKTTIRIPLATAENAAVVERAFSNLRDWSKAPDKMNPADLAAGIAGIDLKTALGKALDGITSINKKGDALEITRDKASKQEIGGLPIDIDQTIKAKIESSDKSLKISGIEGISMSLPVPAELAKAVGLPQPFKANLKELSISEAEKDGSRTLTVKTDSLLESVQIKVDRDLKPIAADKLGNISLDLTIKNKDVSLPIAITFNPAQLEKPTANGPDFKISLKAADSNYVKMIETMAGTSIEGPLKDMVSGVTSISKTGDRISISRDKSSNQDLGGVILEAAKDIRFKVSPNGPSGARLSNIEGINLKLPIQLPQTIKDLGIDPGKEINCGLKTIDMSSPDDKGRRNLNLETNHLLKQVSVLLGADMKPALDPKGNWYMYGRVDNPLANKQMPMLLRFDQRNQLAMSTQELMRIGAQAAWQASDNKGAEGIGFGVIGVATEAGALALDVKDKAVETVVAVKDTVVEGAGVVKDVAVQGARLGRSLAIEGLNKVEQGASTVGGWIERGWKSIW